MDLTQSTLDFAIGQPSSKHYWLHGVSQMSQNRIPIAGATTCERGVCVVKSVSCLVGCDEAHNLAHVYLTAQSLHFINVTNNNLDRSDDFFLKFF